MKATNARIGRSAAAFLALAAVPLSVLAARSGLQPRREDWPLIALTGVLCVPVTMLVQFGGLARTSVTAAVMLSAVPGPTLRDAREEDANLLLPMMADFNRVEGIAWDVDRMERALTRLLAEPPLGRVVIAEDEGPAGYAVVTWGYDLEYGGRDAFLTELYVRPAYRRRGLARRLLARMETIARASGAGALHLGVRPENTAALGLYRDAGYVRIRRDFFTKPLGE